MKEKKIENMLHFRHILFLHEFGSPLSVKWAYFTQSTDPLHQFFSKSVTDFEETKGKIKVW